MGFYKFRDRSFFFLDLLLFCPQCKEKTIIIEGTLHLAIPMESLASCLILCSVCPLASSSPEIHF